ncbi:hypothetical protein LK994_04710 [Ferruginibacter lapsinanis]|uniref:hypothetical protein n=1 Tax=Ferruginibacter lapsinanis TaxID=563172 RepID=UPI001E5F52A5|nr:hypothetical protein [Ferruginibacter lapsinanis]UEG50774.1 hypothetical protein LK994_04710 [Ferruginibacter lapsinanis]
MGYWFPLVRRPDGGGLNGEWFIFGRSKKSYNSKGTPTEAKESRTIENILGGTRVEKMPWWLLGIVWSVLLMLLILSQESSSSFIYFQF